MRKFAPLLLLMGSLALMNSCGDDDDDGDQPGVVILPTPAPTGGPGPTPTVTVTPEPTLNVSGTWTGAVTSDETFYGGHTTTAVLRLSQTGDRVSGTSTYSASGVTEMVEGFITDSKEFQATFQDPRGFCTD